MAKRNKINSNGRITAIIIGLMCMVLPWLGDISLAAKFLISGIGAVLIWMGTR